MKMNGMRVFVSAVVAVSAWSGQAWAIDSAGSGFWDVGATWVGGAMPTIDDDVVIKTGHTITNRDLLTRDVKSLTIENTGVLTHSGPADTELYKVILSIVNNLTIDAGGKINVTGNGYNPQQGPGKKQTGGTTSGSYGGIGSGYSGFGTTYGSIIAPTNWGSGGYGPGGGAVILNVGGETILNGDIIARNFMTAGTGDPYKYPGSGGSVFLATATLSGSGTIDAGAGGTANGGGGGRIAVILTNGIDFAGVKLQASSTNGGAAGTIYMQTKDHDAGKGVLRVDAKNNAPVALCSTLQNGKEPSAYEFSEIVLTNGAKYALDTNDTLVITNTIVRGDSTNRNNGIYLYGGALTIPAAFTFSNHFIGISHTGSVFNPAASLTVGTNAMLLVDVPWTMNYPVTIEGGGWISHTPNFSTESNKIDLMINGNLEIKTNGAVNVDGKGYAATYGPGKPGTSNAGGSHGGRGSYNSSLSEAGTTYGSISSPTNCGSGGQSTAGGGAVRLNVTGTTTLHGAISADGGASMQDFSGSGGSVFLKTGDLAGSGWIRANGGYCGRRVSGGGGRVAVILTNSTDFGSVKVGAFGGAHASAYDNRMGACGTVYTETKEQGGSRGTLLINASNVVWGVQAAITTFIHYVNPGTNVSDTTCGTVIVMNKAILAISNQTLTVKGDWFVATNAAFTALTNSTVAFAGDSAATVYGSNTFFNLTCTNAGKTLSFQAGMTNRVNGLLKLGSTGSEPLVTLRSTSPGDQWYLTLTTGVGTQQIGMVSVKDSNAGGGQWLTAAKGSVNAGNNAHWLFPKSGGTVLVVR